MLGAMRRHSKSFIIYLLFAMIIVVFVFTFNTSSGKSGGCTPPEVPIYATVGGDSIDHDDLMMGMELIPRFIRFPPGKTPEEKAMNAVQMEVFLMASGADLAALSSKDLEDLSPETANAYLQIVEMLYLASEEARDLGFKVGDKELARAMYPEDFYEDQEVDGEEGPTTKKVFKEKEFTNWIVYGLHSSPQDYEAFVETILLAFKLQQFISGVVTVEGVEAELAARAKGTKVDLDYVEFGPDMFENQVSLAPEELAKFATENAEAVKAYYDSHPARFHAEAGYKFAGIFVAGTQAAPPKRGAPTEPPKPTPEEMEAAKAKAQTIRDRIDGKQELYPNGQLPLDIDPSAGGTITLKSEDLVVPEEPFKRFKEVAKRESEDEETKGRSGLFADWLSHADLATSKLGANAPAALETATKDSLVGPVETEAGYWLLYVVDMRDKKDLSLEQATNEIAETMLKEKKGPEMALAKAEEFRKVLAEAADEGINEKLEEFRLALAGEAEDLGAFDLLLVRKTGNFYLSMPGKSIPGIGQFDDLFTHAFKLTDDKPLADSVFVNPDTQRAYVVKLTGRTVPPAALPEEDLQAEKEFLAYSRDIPYFQSWLKTLRQRALERGDMQRTQEFQDLLASLKARQDEAEQRAAKKAAKDKKDK